MDRRSVPAIVKCQCCLDPTPTLMHTGNTASKVPGRVLLTPYCAKYLDYHYNAPLL